MRDWAARTVAVAGVVLAVAGCDLQYALMGFSEPKVSVASALPVELAYREGKGGLVILTGRVNGKADVDFILDTGAPVSVLIDGPRTVALGLDTGKARPLGDPDHPATPVGVIGRDFHVAFGPIALAGLTAIVVPEKSMPCRERFDAIGFAGVIGADLFRRFVVEIDPIAKRIRFHEPGTWRAPDGASTLPVTFGRGHPFIDARLTLASGETIATRMNVDIGMNRALTLVAGSHPAIAMPVDGAVRKSCFVNGTREERAGPAVAVTLGNATIPVASPVYSASPNAVDDERRGTIGIGLFKDRRLVIDYPGRRLVVI